MAYPTTSVCDDANVADRPPPLSPSRLDFDEWYKREHPRVVGAFYVVCREIDVAQDSTDEAFARALAHWPQVGAMNSPGAWVYRVALNHSHKTGVQLSAVGDARSCRPCRQSGTVCVNGVSLARNTTSSPSKISYGTKWADREDRENEPIEGRTLALGLT
jgi:hypothetical protein